MLRGSSGRGGVRSKLIEDIYQAAFAPELWPRIMNAIADEIGAGATHLMIYDSAQHADILGHFERGDPAAIALYMQEYLPIDPRIALRLRTEIGAVIADREIWRAEERLSSPVYHDFQLRHGLHDITGAQMSIGSTFIWYGVAKERSETFSRQEIDRLQLLMPHIRQSLRVHLEMRQLAAQRDMLGRLWSDSGKALLLVDACGRIRFCNALAEQLIREGIIIRRDGHIGFGDTRTHAALCRELGRMRERMPSLADSGNDHLGGNHLILHPTNGAQYGVRLMRMQEGMDTTGTADSLLITLTPLDLHQGFTTEELQRFGTMFGLTGAEQRIVHGLAAGIDVEAFARMRRIKSDTARKQLKSALGKTGARSQKDLLRLVERFCFLRTR